MVKGKRNKIIVEINKNGQLVRLWQNANKAAVNLGISRGVMSHLLSGYMKQYNGITFRFATEEEIETYSALYGIDTSYKKEPKRKRKVVDINVPLPVDEPVPIIPADQQKPHYDEVTLSPFEQILKRVREQKI